MQHASGIDAWRGWSVGLVVLHHVAIRLPLADSALGAVVPARLTAALNWNGYEAVCVFFVISGFLITTHTLDRDGEVSAIRPVPFWIRRFARIAPPLAILVATLSALHLVGAPRYVIDDPDQSLLGAIVSASTLWLNWYEGHTGYLPGGWDVLWSLSVEEVFYLGFPLVALACRSERVLAGVALALALTMPVTHGWNHDLPIWREKHYLPGMSAIALGVATAVAARRSWVSPAVARALGWVGTGAVVGALVWGDLVWDLLGEGYLLVVTGGAALAVWGAWADRGAAPWRVTAPLRAVGRWSYEVYLTHMFVVFAVVDGFAAIGWGKPEGHWAALAALVGSTLLGWLFAVGVSEPANRAVRRAWLSGAAGAPAPG